MTPDEAPPEPTQARVEAERRRPLGQAQQMTEETAQKLLTLFERSAPVQRLRASQAASAVTGTIGFALLMIGVENAAQDLPLLSNPYGSIVVGILLLLATGLLLRKLIGGAE